MGSESRYSIVQNMTKQKVELMKSKQTMKDEIARSESILRISQESFEREKRKILDEANGQIDSLGEDIRSSEMRLEHLKASIKDKEKSIDDQIATIDESLKTIQSISKDAGEAGTPQ